MKLGIKSRILIVHSLLLALVVGLSAFIYFNGSFVVASSSMFIARDLPAYDKLSKLKLNVVAQEPILYEYYASTDRDRFLTRWETHQAELGALVKSMNEDFSGHHEVATVEQHLGELNILASQLDATLKVRDIDWDHARHILTLASQASTSINADLDQLLAAVQKRVGERAIDTQRKIDGITRIVFAFCIVLLAIAIIVGYFVNAYMAESAERRKLAMFAERNPNPVLSFTRDAQVIYANPGATQMLQHLHADHECPMVLLPANLPQRIGAMLTGGQDFEHWEYDALGRTFECGVQHVVDFDIFHAFVSDITERKQAKFQLEYQASHDALTGLPNRRSYLATLEAALGGNICGAVMLMSVDRFGVITEGLGHVVGDQVLIAIAERLRASLAMLDHFPIAPSAFRFESELFAIVLPNLAEREPASAAARAICSAMQAPFMLGSRQVFATVSIGLSLFPDDGSDVVMLTRNADAVVRRLVKAGGNDVAVYTQEMNARALERLELENDLRFALERGELELYYQPQVELRNGRVIGVESLLRWKHPQRGFVSPAEFIPIAEESNLILPIGEWVLETACRCAKAWQSAGLNVPIVAVNVSGRQFENIDLPALVRHTLAETDLPPHLLELEVTESVAMHDVARTVSTLLELAEIGVHLSIDDFGTGYSSLAYLKRFPIHKLKIDQSFVRNMTHAANDEAIVAAIINLGHSLNLQTIAEGVESQAELDALRRLDCDEIQGYLFSRPLPLAQITQLLQDKRQLETLAVPSSI